MKKKISKPALPEWLSAAQIAELKGCTKSAVYTAISDGRLRSRTIAGRIVVHRMVAQAWDVQLHTGRPRKAQVVSPEEAKDAIERWEGEKELLVYDGTEWKKAGEVE